MVTDRPCDREETSTIEGRSEPQAEACPKGVIFLFFGKEGPWEAAEGTEAPLANFPCSSAEGKEGRGTFGSDSPMFEGPGIGPVEIGGTKGRPDGRPAPKRAGKPATRGPLKREYKSARNLEWSWGIRG